jgi:hypothetical protein
MLGAKQITLALVVAFATTLALAAPPPGKGGGGGGGGGGKPAAPDLYGDLVLIDRDVDGVPITTEGLGPKDQLVQVPQPIMLGTKPDCPLEFTGLEKVDVSSVYALVGVDARYIPRDEYGEIPEEYAPCTTEADFERLSAARSPENVTDHALMEMVTTLNIPGAVISLDEAGRLQVRYTATDPLTGEPFEVVKTIDAPRENLGGFQRLLEAAELSHPEVAGGAAVEDLPVRPGGHGNPSVDLLDRAAAMFGAAGSKAGQIGLDVLIYSTQIMAIPTDMTAEAKLAFGTPIAVAGGATYFDFSSFEYDRALTYAGDVCYLKVESPVGPPSGEGLPIDVTGQIVREAILPLVFPPVDNPDDLTGGLFDVSGTYTGFRGENAWGFTRAADDARAVIQWVHDHPVPIELAEYCELGLPKGQRSMRPTE